MVGFLSGLSKLVLGILLALTVLGGTGLALTRYFLTRNMTLPPRPVFANDPSPAPAAATATPSPIAEAPPPSPAEGYAAKVIQPIGLILRQEPSVDAVQLGGIEYNQEVTVLEDSADGAWQRVRLNDGIEGWIKGGNTEKL